MDHRERDCSFERERMGISPSKRVFPNDGDYNGVGRETRRRRLVGLEAQVLVERIIIRLVVGIASTGGTLARLTNFNSRPQYSYRMTSKIPD